MSDISGVRRDVRLTAAFLELLGTVGKCLELPHQGRDEGDISEHYHRDVVLAHISMCLGIASESASVPEAFIAELEALCKVLGSLSYFKARRSDGYSGPYLHRASGLKSRNSRR